MRETIGISQDEGSSSFRHPPGAGRSGWRISNDITLDNLESIIENTEDLFT